MKLFRSLSFFIKSFHPLLNKERPRKRKEIAQCFSLLLLFLLQNNINEIRADFGLKFH